MQIRQSAGQRKSVREEEDRRTVRGRGTEDEDGRHDENDKLQRTKL